MNNSASIFNSIIFYIIGPFTIFFLGSLLLLFSGVPGKTVGALFTVTIIAYSIWFSYMLISSTLKAGKQYDALFEELGFWGRPYLLIGRIYEGMWGKYPVTITYLPPVHGFQPRLHVMMPVHHNHTLAVSYHRPRLRKKRGKKVLHKRYWVYSNDKEWAKDHVRTKKVKEAIRTVLGENTHGPRELYLEEHRMWLRDFPMGLTEENMRDTIKAMIALI